MPLALRALEQAEVAEAGEDVAGEALAGGLGPASRPGAGLVARLIEEGQEVVAVDDEAALAPARPQRAGDEVEDEAVLQGVAEEERGEELRAALALIERGDQRRR
jgi:hypothetical protein